MNLGNDITEIHSTVREVLQLECHNEIYQLWQPSCWNCRELKRENMNCGNQVAENGKKKKRIVMAEIWGEIKKNATFIIFLQQITGD